ncbi:uncharacterized protein LOC108438297 isoform X4 [Pygocentrus nattereri]|uniref:uncharacterized protein LOC108438297 isoform X4 n=1 Tax=Pygocentrus nattereri TaxID=42514 RepID=UPI000814B42E|nr:uncharacterized protein LOC108438297 isoform X4 [Pygocentrus nattereri]
MEKAASSSDKKVQGLTVVLFGNSSAVGDENIQSGQPTADDTDFSMIVPISKKISGRDVNIINLLDLQDLECDLNYVDQAIVRLVNENQIHAFIFVLQLDQFTDADKVGLEWLQKKFGESVLPFVMILFTYEKEEEKKRTDTIIDDLNKNPVLEQLLEKCGNRCHTCSKSMNNQSEMKTLLEKIGHMVSANKWRCYTAELYNTASNLRKILQDSKNQQSEYNSQLQEESMDVTGSKQTTAKEKVSKMTRGFRTSKPRTVWNRKKKHNPSMSEGQMKSDDYALVCTAVGALCELQRVQ